MKEDKDFVIDHLFKYPQFLSEIAEMIYCEFWTEVAGVTASSLAVRLMEAKYDSAVPLSLLALVDGQPAGTINLIENDDDSRKHLKPWLAALLVYPAYRQRGIGGRLIKELLQYADKLGIKALYLGTDIREYYLQFGASVFEEVKGDFCIMKFDIREEGTYGI